MAKPNILMMSRLHKRYVLGPLLLCALGFSHSASSQTIAVPSATNDPSLQASQKILSPVPLPYNWTGAYAGIQVGGGIGSSRRDFTAAGVTTKTFDIDSVAGGLDAGYDYQFKNNIVAGLEGGFLVNSVMGGVDHPDSSFNYGTQNPWLITLRPRFGYAFGTLLPYITGGFALGNVRTFTYTKATGALGSDFVRTEPGWIAGAGLEKALSPEWSIKAEYSYVQLNEADGPSSTGAPTKVHFNEHIGVVGLNYKFDHIGGQHAQIPSPWNASEDPNVMSLATLTGVELGGSISNYRYQEHVVSNTEFMHETGAKFGVTTTATQSFPGVAFITGDFRFAYSSNDYSSPGSGTQNNMPDYLWDIRLLTGKDFAFENVNYGRHQIDFDVSPYVGFGYRNLFNDARGTSSLGSHGYRRDSQYFYLPVGVTPRFRVANDARISTNIEYDQLIEGWQTSYLSDVSSSNPDLTNGQFGGYGLRGSVMYERGSWSAGPFFDYWNIDRSAGVPYAGGYWFEPHNQTIEYGLEARYRF